MVKLHKHVVFVSSEDGFVLAATGELKDLQACKLWIATNGKPDVAYRTGTILEKDIRVQPVSKNKLVIG